MADVMVQKTQEWLNNKYGDKPGFIPLDLSEEAGIVGRTGWTTIYALLGALQLELGLNETGTNFGPSTQRLFNEMFEDGIKPPIDETAVCGRYGGIYGIIQGALWCKGYPAVYGAITEHFDYATQVGVSWMRDDAGIDPGSTVTLNVMKALLSMNQYKLVWKGSSKIQTIQRTLNRNYEDYIGLSPCDGLYGREMNKAMIMVLQAIEGYTPEEANGNFGSGTKSRLHMLFIPHVVNLEATYLFRSALCCNGYDVELGYDWGNDVEIATFDFQSDMLLNTNGAADTDTWMALMISRGNIDRPSNGCDTRFEITSERLRILKNEGYSVVGRYLTGGSFKELRVGEAERITDGGMSLFPIFQESGANMAYFTPERGKTDALNSSKAARKLGMPKGTIIYFAVDTDPLDYQIEDYILPYFRALHESFDTDYKIGVYGTRNTCTQVCDNGYALTSFVSDMSYGFSGNMGFKIPENWNLDQFYELSTSETGWDFDLDKTTYSGRYPVVDNIQHRNYIQPAIPEVEPETPSILSFIEDIRTLETLYKQYYDANLASINGIPLLPNMLVIAMTNFLRSQEYNDWTWFFTTGSIIDSGFVSDIQENHSDIWEHMYNYIKENTEEFPRLDITDGETGLIDLSHFGATLEAYLGTGFFPSFWASWGGDLATGMSDTTINYKNRNEPDYEIYAGKTLQEIADATVGKATLLCNYTDFCTDFDAYKISCYIEEEIKNSTAETLNFHLLSDALMWYYSSGQYRNRFVWFFNELGLETQTTLGTLKAEIYERMNGAREKAILLPLKGNTPTQEVNAACCDSFANYIYKMINQ
ncbi:MAG TPA: hypothetical protein DEF85_07645 [Clostridiaceae bacterium]|jgi:peptidoglycan hydrolase-like protein with peptidoglycan-binding domain|nr:hypothetical protein [Clostridiaceae bacterium]HBX48748.1 hypothetical protein [Clostridiaceae bacterium]HCS10766.1 hypothetical protein [Clostridiales bacterium]